MAEQAHSDSLTRWTRSPPATPPWAAPGAASPAARPLARWPREHARLMRKLGATDREAWLVALAVQYRVELEAAMQPHRAATG